MNPTPKLNRRIAYVHLSVQQQTFFCPDSSEGIHVGTLAQNALAQHHMDMIHKGLKVEDYDGS